MVAYLAHARHTHAHTHTASHTHTHIHERTHPYTQHVGFVNCVGECLYVCVCIYCVHLGAHIHERTHSYTRHEGVDDGQSADEMAQWKRKASPRWLKAPPRWLQPENLPTWLQREAVALVGLRTTWRSGEERPLPWAAQDKYRVARVHRMPHLYR